jgi:hypothetical protein
MKVRRTFLALKAIYGNKSVHNDFQFENKLWFWVNLSHCHQPEFEPEDVSSI